MSGDVAIRAGMPVYGASDERIGTVERIHGNGLHVNGQHYDRDRVSRVTADGVYLTGGALAATGQRDLGRAPEGEIRIPVAEERLVVGTRAVELGEVAIRKTVETGEQSVPVTLRREEVRVREVDFEDRALRTGDDLFKEGTIRVQVRGEEAVVARETVVTGEVVIEKDRIAEERQITDTVRRQRVDVEEDYRQGRGEFEGRAFSEAEPDYRTGFAAGHDERYVGREWADVEPGLQRDYMTRGMSRGRWVELRADIQAGWEKARGR